MREQNIQELPLPEDLVRAQLTLRAVVWDAGKTGAAETGKLDREWEKFGILKLDLPQCHGQRGSNCRIKYESVQACMKKAGILEKDALLVTDDAGLSEYVYGKGRDCPAQQVLQGQAEICRQDQTDSMAVVYYEKESDGKYADAKMEESGGMYVDADMVVQGFGEVGIQFLDRVHKRKNHLPWNILYTKRTCVREIAVSDLDALFAMYRGKGITDYTEPLLEREKEEAYTKSYIDCMYYYYGYGMWVVCDRNTGRLIGRAGIEHREMEDGSVRMELGYIIAREYQNQGYAQEVCGAILEYAAEELELEELHCFIHRQNAASIRVAEKLGFVLCGKEERHQGDMLHFCRKFIGVQD